MASTYRDRTAEFQSLTGTLRRVGGATPIIQSLSQETDPSPSQQSLLPSRSEFNQKASRIGLGVNETSHKISRISQLTKRSSMFNDPTIEIQELTALVKNDIKALNTALTDLQTLQQIEIANGSYSEDRIVHSTAVCDDLKSKLMGATKKLHDVLTTRTENMKAHENRKQMFSTNASRENPFLRQAKTSTEPPPWSSSSNSLGSSQSSASLQNGAQVGNQLRRRSAIENTPSEHMQMSMLQQQVSSQENFSQSRAHALHNVESTISELGGIFTHLATMVAQQGELAIRIDDNMEESLTNVENARGSLLRHLNQISSNRWLLIKIFAVIILFLFVFIIFVA